VEWLKVKTLSANPSTTNIYKKKNNETLTHTYYFFALLRKTCLWSSLPISLITFLLEPSRIVFYSYYFNTLI
jgi:hypothetical protein